jgi:hypothetical protein
MISIVRQVSVGASAGTYPSLDEKRTEAPFPPSAPIATGGSKATSIHMPESAAAVRQRAYIMLEEGKILPH